MTLLEKISNSEICLGLEEYLNSIRYGYCINKDFTVSKLSEYRDIELIKKGESIYFYLLVKFIEILDKNVDVENLSDKQIMDLICTVVTVYNIKVENTLLFILGSDTIPLEKLTKEEKYSNFVDMVIEGCDEIFLSILLDFRKK